MFKKKSIVPEDVTETVEIQKSEKQEAIQHRDNPASFFDFTEQEEKEIIKEESPTLKKRKQKPKKEKKITQKKTEKVPEDFDDEVIVAVVGEESWIWANTEEYELKKEKEAKKKGKKVKQVEEKEEIPQPKKELSTYFEESKENNKKLSKKELKLKRKEQKSKNNKKSKRDELSEDIKNQRVFRYDGKKYTKVEEFITYLNEHYLDIDKISEEVLEDENFFGWVNKNSGVFAKSLKDFQEIKSKIENNS